MELLGEVNGRQVLYISSHQDTHWIEELPTRNWLVCPIGHQGDIDRIYDITEKCLQRNVLYVCALGQESSAIEDAFDLAIVDSAIRDGQDIRSPDTFEKSPLTTMHRDLEEGFWFATFVAFHEWGEIDKVVCLDLTQKGERDRLVDLITKINSGWLPSDEQLAAS